MLDWARITGFDWDEGNARKSTDKHDVGQPEAEQVFFNAPLLVVPDVKHSAREPRFHALGKTDQDRRLHVTFTLRRDETLLRIISVRGMSRKERDFYGKSEGNEIGEESAAQGGRDEAGAEVRK